MDMLLHQSGARVTYRGTLPDGREAQLTLAMSLEAATVADAWRRLTSAYGAVDPRSLEIEIWHGRSRAVPAQETPPA